MERSSITKIVPTKYIMKTDDDAFVRIDEVVSSLKKSNSHGLLYGLIVGTKRPTLVTSGNPYVVRPCSLFFRWRVLRFFELQMPVEMELSMYLRELPSAADLAMLKTLNSYSTM